MIFYFSIQSKSVRNWASLTVGLLNQHYRQLEEDALTLAKQRLQQRQDYLDNQLHHHKDIMKRPPTVPLKHHQQAELKKPASHIPLFPHAFSSLLPHVQINSNRAGVSYECSSLYCFLVLEGILYSIRRAGTTFHSNSDTLEILFGRHALVRIISLLDLINMVWLSFARQFNNFNV